MSLTYSGAAAGVGCVNPAFPIAEQNFEFTTPYVNDTVVLINDTVSYNCIAGGYKWDHDFDEVNYEATCLENGTWSNNMTEMFCQMPTSECQKNIITYL